MDLSTEYLGLSLPHPIVVGASPIVDDLELVQRAADAGAAAIVMHSLFEEQLTTEQLATHRHLDSHSDSNAEASSYFPEPAEFALGPDEYLEQLRRIKERAGIPVVGSLNGATNRGWLEHARLIEQAGADALELNVYYLPMDPDVSGAEVEQQVVDMVRHVREGTHLPIAVKLAPAYSSLPHLARRLVEAGASGLVLFNRYYEPDIDIEQLELAPRLALSSSSELLLRLRWLAALYGRVGADLAVTGGVHGSLDALKAVMAGATTVQMVSELLQKGPERITDVVAGMARWLEEHEYSSLAQARGSMSLDRCPDPTHYHRGNYLRILRSFQTAMPS